MTASIEVVDNAEKRRYEARVDGELAGSAFYRGRPGRIEFIHTEVDEAFEGQGVGGTLVSFALEDAKAHELEVVPFCPFVLSYIKRHREYVELVPERARARFGL